MTSPLRPRARSPKDKQGLGAMLRDPEMWRALGRADTWKALVLLVVVAGAILGVLYGLSKVISLIAVYGVAAAFKAGGVPALILIVALGFGVSAWDKWSKRGKG